MKQVLGNISKLIELLFWIGVTAIGYFILFGEPYNVIIDAAADEADIISEFKPEQSFSGERALDYVEYQTALGPRPTASDANIDLGNFIIERVRAYGWKTELRTFTFRGKRGRNIVAKKGESSKDSNGILIIGAHYDTRPAADEEEDESLHGEWIEGANDGGSGVAVLLDLARVLDIPDGKSVWLVFFDAEDRGGLDNWPYSVGAYHFANTELYRKIEAVVIVDMVGDAEQQIYYEENSDPELREEIWSVAASLGYSDTIIAEEKHKIMDDHMPFIVRDIPAVDIIDFDYPYWHTLDDTLDKVSAESLERVGRTLELWVEGEATTN